ncbi:MAG: YIP1 family protein [Gemmatimonadota bacterium]
MEQRPYSAGEWPAGGQPARQPAEEPESAERTPWERAGASFPRDLFASWMECMAHPSLFFRRLDPAVPFSTPLIFYLVFSVLGSAAFTASSIAFLPAMYAAEGAASSPEGHLLWFFLSPFIAVFSLVFYVLFTHLGVLLFVRDGRPIGVTARSLCYVAAPGVLNIVPFIGWLAAFIWSLWLAVVAIQQAHRTTGGRAFAAVFVIPFLVSFLVFLAIVLFVLMAVATFGTGSATG